MNPINQTDNRLLTSNKNSNPESFNRGSKDNSNSQFVLPRQGWQDKQALLKALIKAKRALDIAEISNFLN